MLRAPKSIVVTCSFSFALLPTALRMPVTDVAHSGALLTQCQPQVHGPRTHAGHPLQARAQHKLC